MNHPKCALLLGLVLATSSLFASNGWVDLFPGGHVDAWRSARSDVFPRKGWTMDSGVLTVEGSGGAESRGGGDIITRARYNNFELELDFRLTPGANSGVKIFVQPNLSSIDPATARTTSFGSSIGLEFQILDDQRHPDAKRGRDGDRTLGSLYDLVPASRDKVVRPMGEWNHVRIVSQGRHVEFWLNGKMTVEFARGSAAFRSAVARSKFHAIPGFGEWADGHILLQDHGDTVSFRNVRIRELPAREKS